MDTLGDDQLITGSYDGAVRDCVDPVPTESAEGASATCTRTLSGIHTGLLVSGVCFTAAGDVVSASNTSCLFEFFCAHL